MLSEIRNCKIGFVFQTFNLIPRTSALRNVELPMLYSGMGRFGPQPPREGTARHRRHGGPDEAPAQRAVGRTETARAIARAMANDPAIILADEPTGALDTQTGHMVMDLFHRLHREEGKTIVLITHNPELAAETERIVTISDGRIIRTEKGGMPRAAV